MKKLLGISLVAVLAVSPMMARAEAVAGDPGTTVTTGAVSATNPPKYALAQSTGNDGKVATAGYVKGAYNAAIKAVNKLEDTKQNVISDLETIRSNASAGANALQKADITEGTTNGAITVKGTAVPVHGLGSAAYTASTAYASAAQGALADTALQTAGNGLTKSGTTVSADLTDKGGLEFAGSTDGSKTISVKVDGTTIEKNTTTGALQVKSGTYATAAQGALADTALQSTSALNGANLTDGTVAKTALASGVQTSLDLADSAIQSVVEGSTNGTIAVDGTDVAVHGLGDAAYSGVQAAAAPTTYTGTGLTTKGYVDEKVATATSGMVTASSTNTFTNKTIDAEGTGNSITNLKTTNFKSGTIVTSVGTTGADTSLPTEKAVRSAITTATTGMAKQAGVVETIKDVTLTSALANTAVTGTVATVTDWTNETAGTAQVTGSVTSGTVNTSIDSASVVYTES